MIYLRDMQKKGEKVTASDVAKALDIETRSVDGIFTAGIQRKGLGVQIPAEIQLDDGTYRQVKYLELTPGGLAFIGNTTEDSIG
jgi:hypothetical protein